MSLGRLFHFTPFTLFNLLDSLFVCEGREASNLRLFHFLKSFFQSQVLPVVIPQLEVIDVRLSVKQSLRNQLILCGDAFDVLLSILVVQRLHDVHYRASTRQERAFALGRGRTNALETLN